MKEIKIVLQSIAMLICGVLSFVGLFFTLGLLTKLIKTSFELGKNLF